MARLHTGLLICVLYNDTANSSNCSMSKVWLMSDELIGEGNMMAVLFRLSTSLKVAGSISNGFIGIFHSHSSSDRTMTMGST